MNAGPRHPQLHGVGCVAVDARHRMARPACAPRRTACWFIFSKPLMRSPPPSFLYGTYDRRVAVQAGAGLLADLLALGERLVVEHVGVAALLAEIHRERVAGPHGLQPRILLEPRLRDDRAWVGLGRRARHALRCRRSACAPDRRCACSRRTGTESSCPRRPGPRCRRSSSTTR